MIGCQQGELNQNGQGRISTSAPKSALVDTKRGAKNKATSKKWMLPYLIP
jgi:hypothetical protein